jgi:aspartate aminotransferase
MRARGVSVLDVGGGDPDFDAPAHIIEATARSALDGFTHYTPSRGIPALRAAVAEKLAADNGIKVDPDTEVLVTPSSKHALFAAVMAVLDPGDEVLLPTPSWVSYQAMARLAGATPVPVPLSASDGFRITSDRMAAALTTRTRALIINTPNNPTGHVVDEREAEEIVAFATEHDLVVIIDEIYEKIVFGARHFSLARLPGAAKRTITVNGLSKAYAMPGWRLGYAAGPADLVTAMLTVHQHTVACAGSFAQQGAVAALTGPQDAVTTMAAEYATRADMVVTALNNIPNVTCGRLDGAFYAFPDISATVSPDCREFAERLLVEESVAVTPGVAFGPGGERHIRISLTSSQPVLAEVVNRIARVAAARP